MSSSGATCAIPFFEAFDRPDTNASCPKRPVTTIAPQALSLLNSPLSSDAAHALAARAEREAGPDIDAKVERAYLLTLGRRPDDEESGARPGLPVGPRVFVRRLLPRPDQPE